MRDLKQQLIDGGTFGFKNFSLSVCVDDNDGITETISLEDGSLPLHLCGVVDNTTIRILSDNMRIELVTQRG